MADYKSPVPAPGKNMGRPDARVEGRAKVTGGLLYGSDVPVANPAHAYLLTSANARGSVRKLDLAAAKALPGEIEIFTHENTPKLRPVMPLFMGGFSSTKHLPKDRMFPIVPLFPSMIEAGDIGVARWEAVLGDVLQLGPRLIVPGHGNLAGTELPTQVLDYFKDVRATVAAADGVTDGLEARVRARYPTWENTRFIDPARRYLARGRA